MKQNGLTIISETKAFKVACAELFVKVSFIRKLPNGKWRVVSRKGKNLGTYKTREEAVKRLQQVEFFKHKKASDDNYSSTIRNLRKHYDDDAVEKFQKAYKKIFDQELLNGNEEPEEISLKEALKEITAEDDNKALKKTAAAIDFGNPDYAGKYLADLLRFILQRIRPEIRQKSIDNLKKKVYYLNEFEIAGKKTPVGASTGHALTILKTMLLEHSPEYIRNILNSIVRHL